MTLSVFRCLLARHVVEQEKDIDRAMEFLNECKDLLKIEDILPFFPDFVTIDNFKVSFASVDNKLNKKTTIRWDKAKCALLNSKTLCISGRAV